MLYEVTGDLLRNHNFNIFCHQTNCKGVMGAGIAKQIAALYPIVQEKNKEYCKRNPLGTVLPIQVSEDRICVNIYGQDGYGRGKRYTDYDALRAALDSFATRLNSSKIPKYWNIGFPYRIGCGLAGGEWDTVRKMLEEFSDKVEYNVFVVKLPTEKEV